MAVTITTLGSNSARIDYDSGTTVAALITAVDTYITAHGWAAYDASAGTNARAYRALNKDASTYKYVVLDYNTANRLYVKVYESWDSGAHSGTNLAYQSATTGYGQQVYLTAGGHLYIFAHARYLIMCSRSTGLGPTIGSATGGAWCGNIEVTRDNSEDTTILGVPCWCWAHGSLIDAVNYSVAFPRMKDGSVGQMASQYTFSSTFCGCSSPSGVMNIGLPQYPNIWNKHKWAMDVTVGRVFVANTPEACSPELRGRLYGVKILGRGGGFAGPPASVAGVYANFMEDTQIKVDSDFFNDPSGTFVDYWILSTSASAGYMRFALPK